MTFSIYYGGITKIKPDENIEIEQVLSSLKSPLIKSLIDSIRAIQHDDPKELKKERNKIKKNLSYVTPAGVFQERRKNCILSQSGLAPIDIDDVKNVYELKDKLSKDKYVRLLFISPSGNGLKIFIEIPKSIEEYPRRVCNFYKYLEDNYRIPMDSLDASTHDISRACYLSYDENYYYNPTSQVYKGMDNVLTVAPAKDTTRSAEEYREAIKRLYMGQTKEQVFKYLERFSKWKDAHPAYREHTYNKAKAYVQANTPTAQEKTDLINELADLIFKKYHIFTMLSDKNPDVYIYQGGIYVLNGRCCIQEHIGNCLGKHYSKILADKVIEKIMVKTYMTAEEFFEEPDPKYICVQNGILNIETKELQEFTHKLRFFNKLPVTYNKDAQAIQTQKHFEATLKPEDRMLIQELYGFLLYRDYKFQKAFMFSGEGGNGKSITLMQINALLGIENTVNLSLETLEKHHFMKGYLHKKMANIADDIGKAKLTETRTFKEITGSNIITCDKKNTDPVTFANYAKQVFNANQIPLVDDDTDGFWRRWIIVRFEKSFLLRTEYEAKEKRGDLQDNHRIADTNIIHKLTTKEELSGVLNWAIDGYARLIEQNGFSYDKSLEETRQYMRRYSSSVIAFVYDCTEPVQDAKQYENVPDMYKQYITYCFSRKKRLHPVAELKFRKILEEEIPVERKRTAAGWEVRAMFTRMLPIREDV